MAIFTNQATLSYQNVTTSSNVVTGEILDALSVTKSAVTDRYVPGGDVTWAVSIRGTGPATLTGLVLTDDLGAFPFGTGELVPFRYREGSLVAFVNGAPVPAPTVTSTQPLTVTGITVPAGGNVILLYETVATEFAPRGINGEVTNTVTVSGGGIQTPVSATATVSPVAAPSLSITKAVAPTVVTENGVITYTFVIQNLGNTEAVATDNVTVTDTFLPVLSGISVALNGQALTDGVGYTYNETSGAFSTVPGVITVPAASFTRNPESGVVEVTPGTVTLTVSGTV
ncbi:MAG: hypothetical protein IKC69_00870 [Clostridia bacterium]|nr:hypothetical protein [Clostridia bacterium]